MTLLFDLVKAFNLGLADLNPFLDLLITPFVWLLTILTP